MDYREMFHYEFSDLGTGAVSQRYLPSVKQKHEYEYEKKQFTRKGMPVPVSYSEQTVN